MAREMPTFAASSYSSSSSAIADLWNDGIDDTSAVPGLRRFNPILQPAAQLGVQMVQQAVGRRVVQVFVSDPDPKVPLENCLLYKGDVKVTDATDQELYFELDIRSLLEAHNKVRTAIMDKSVKDRAEYLEPAKIRDLKMSVVTITTL